MAITSSLSIIFNYINVHEQKRYSYDLKTDEDNNNYIVCDKDIDTDGTRRKYTRVYRYKGGGRR